MSAQPGGARFARFGVFEADLQERTLHRDGLKVRLQNQPFEVLAALLERPGETVTGEELARRVWPDGTFVEFEHSLSTAVLKIRRVLQDSADNPRFIETIPRRGYRFIAPVQLMTESRFAETRGPRSPRKRHWVIPLAAAALVVAAAAYLVPRGTRRVDLLTPAPLTSTPGWEHGPSFSPDGTQVAYAWCEEGTWELRGNCDILVRSIGSQTSVALTDYRWVDTSPAWSPDGRFIAFLRIPPEGMATYYLVPAASGRERQLAETFPPTSPALFGAAVSWFPDGNHVVIVVRDSPAGPHNLAVLSLETGARRALTDTAPTGIGDTEVAVSPDGRKMAFARTALARTPFSDIYIADVAGDFTLKGPPLRLLANQPAPISLAWMPDGDAIIFSTGRGLWRMRVTGGGTRAPERLAFAGSQAADPAVSRDGRRLAYSHRQVRQNVWRVDLAGGNGAAGPPRQLMPSTREDGWPQYSPDGGRITFLSDRSGVRQIYLCDAGGSNLVQLTSLADGVERPYPGWSPDGRRIVFAARTAGNTDLYVVDVQGGAPRRLTKEASAEYQPQWSRDGRWIYFASDRTGAPQIWKIPDSGGEAVRVTEHGGEGPFESPDGRYVHYFKAGSGGAEQLWRRPVAGGDERQLLPEVFRGNFAMAGERVYFIGQLDVGCRCYHLQLLDLATGRRTPLMDVNDVGGGLSVSSDGRSLLYTTVVHTSADLMLVEGFR